MSLSQIQDARIQLLNDRAWPGRAIFGKVRTMVASGLERKCDIRGYVNKVDAFCGGF